MNTLVKTRKLGGSIIVTLPKTLVSQEGILPDQIIEIEVKKTKKSGFGMMKGLPPFSKESSFRGQLDDNLHN